MRSVDKHRNRSDEQRVLGTRSGSVARHVPWIQQAHKCFYLRNSSSWHASSRIRFVLRLRMSVTSCPEADGAMAAACPRDGCFASIHSELKRLLRVLATSCSFGGVLWLRPGKSVVMTQCTGGLRDTFLYFQAVSDHALYKMYSTFFAKSARSHGSLVKLLRSWPVYQALQCTLQELLHMVTLGMPPIPVFSALSKR